MPGCLPWLTHRRDTQREIPMKINADVAPSTYGSKATAATLRSLIGLVPIPMVSELLDLAIRVVEACELATSIEESVLKVRQRVCSLSILIVDKLSSGSNLGQDLKTNMSNLQVVLSKVARDLEGLKSQKRWLLIVFPELNKERVDVCLDRLDEAMEYFTVSHQVRTAEILEKILSKNTQVANTVVKMQKQLDRLEAAVKPHSSPYSVGKQDIPLTPKIFYGSERNIASIVNLLFHTTPSRVCITGPGGMGETLVALAVIHYPTVQQLFGKYRFWIPCIKATSPDLLRRALYTQLSITAQSYDSLDILIDELKATTDRRLILLDNFETSWHSDEAPHDQTQISNILSRLAELPYVTLMVTMTSSFPPCSQIQWEYHILPPLDASASRQAFIGIYPEAASTNHIEVDELMCAVGHIPLAITLMAANGKQSHTFAKNLLKEWKIAGTGMIDKMDCRIKFSFDLVQVSDHNFEVLRLLSILSMLPNGTTMKNLRWWAADISSLSRAIYLLRNAALLEQETSDSGTPRIFLRPTIQAYVHRHKLITPPVKHYVRNVCYKFVLNHKIILDDPFFKDHLLQLATEENNIQTLLIQGDDEGTERMRANALVAFSYYLFQTKQSIGVAQLALTVVIATQDSRCIAEVHEILGKMFKNLSGFGDACQHFKKAHQLFNNLPSGADLARRGECAMQLVEVWMYMQKSAAGEMTTVALQACEDLAGDKSNEYNVARAMLGAGTFFCYARNDAQAIQFLVGAKTLSQWNRMGKRSAPEIL